MCALYVMPSGIIYYFFLIMVQMFSKIYLFGYLIKQKQVKLYTWEVSVSSLSVSSNWSQVLDINTTSYSCCRLWN